MKVMIVAPVVVLILALPLCCLDHFHDLLTKKGFDKWLVS